jgi:hypothetical protein
MVRVAKYLENAVVHCICCPARQVWQACPPNFQVPQSVEVHCIFNTGGHVRHNHPLKSVVSSSNPDRMKQAYHRGDVQLLLQLWPDAAYPAVREPMCGPRDALKMIFLRPHALPERKRIVVLGRRQILHLSPELLGSYSARPG